MSRLSSILSRVTFASARKPSPTRRISSHGTWRTVRLAQSVLVLDHWIDVPCFHSVVTWVDTSKVKRTVMTYNDEVRLFSLCLKSAGTLITSFTSARRLRPPLIDHPLHRRALPPGLFTLSPFGLRFLCIVPFHLHTSPPAMLVTYSHVSWLFVSCPPRSYCEAPAERAQERCVDLRRSALAGLMSSRVDASG